MSNSDAALLVVNDIDDNQFALTRRLARQGYLNVTTAADAGRPWTCIWIISGPSRCLLDVRITPRERTYAGHCGRSH